MFCPDFKAQTSDYKLTLVNNHKLCRNCLKGHHTVRDCTSSFTCRRCQQKHHTLLHESVTAQPSGVIANHTRSDKRVEPFCMQPTPMSPALLATALVKVRSHTGQCLTLRLLLDNGSQASFVSEFSAQQLHLHRERIKVPVTGIGGSCVGKSTGMVKFNLLSCTEPDFSINCSALILPRLGQLLPLKHIDPCLFKEYLDLPLADPAFYKPGSIDVIVGADLYGQLLYGEIRRDCKSNSIAQRTHFGWVIQGRIPDVTTLELSTTLCTTTTISNDINELVQQLWRFNECDDIASASTMTQDERYCEDFFVRTVRRESSGRYQIRYPFRESANLAELSSSREDAFKLFAHQQRRLQSDQKLNTLYDQFMSEYIQLGHMELVNEISEPQLVCYLPHHGVYKESSTTTKLRTVFNASRKYKGRISLNDCLHTGPKLQNDLCTIILNWRLHRIGIVADIEKCFLQILVDKNDADMQRIVWRTDDNEPVIFRLLTVTYGLNCSPYLTIKVLHTLAEDESIAYPEAAKILKESFYIDDCLHGADTIEDALTLQTQLQQLLQRGGFILHKWNSNSADFMLRVQSNKRQRENYCDLNLDRETKALGIYWFYDSDSLGYKVNMTPLSGQVTKRSQLSDVAIIYDPPGLLAPVVVTGNIICQRAWISGCDWDDPLPEPLQQMWQIFRSELNQIEHLRVPRWVGASSNIFNSQ